MYDVVIIGGGIIGTSIARELSRYDIKTVIIEKDNDIANGTTKANSAIVHAGYDAKPGSNKAKFNAWGNPMFDKICEDLDVHFKRIGSLVIATTEEDILILNELLERGKENNIPELSIIDREELRKIEPNLSKDILAALQAKTAGIVGPYELAIAMAENAMDNGVELKLNSKVTNIKKNKFYEIEINSNEIIESNYVINCAGVYADEIDKMVGGNGFNIIPRRGEYFVLEKTVGNLVNSVIFQCPSSLGKGVLVTKTVHGNLLVGPTAENIEDKEENTTTMEGMDYLRKTSRKTMENIPFNKTITSFSGLRASSTKGDFIIGEAEYAKNFINVAGIESPGLTAAPAIASYVKDIIKSLEKDVKEKDDFNPKRRKQIRFMELSKEEKNKVIKEDPRYGKIICRCENITEGEIVDCIHRNAGATTVDGVKRRVRPGMGKCQGGFCMPRVTEILARELNCDITEIKKNNKESYILTGNTKESLDNKDESLVYSEQ